MYRKFKQVVLALIAVCNALNFFSVESLGVKLQFTIHFFFRTAVLLKSFDVSSSVQTL